MQRFGLPLLVFGGSKSNRPFYILKKVAVKKGIEISLEGVEAMQAFYYVIWKMIQEVSKVWSSISLAISKIFVCTSLITFSGVLVPAVIPTCCFLTNHSLAS